MKTRGVLALVFSSPPPSAIFPCPPPLVHHRRGCFACWQPARMGRRNDRSRETNLTRTRDGFRPPPDGLACTAGADNPKRTFATAHFWVVNCGACFARFIGAEVAATVGASWCRQRRVKLLRPVAIPD